MLCKQLITERVKAAVVNVSLVFLHSFEHRPASLDVSCNFGAVLRLSGLIYSIRVYTSYLRSFILLYLPRIPIRPNCSAVKTAIGAVGGNHNHTVAFRAGAYSGLQNVTDVHNMDEYGRICAIVKCSSFFGLLYTRQRFRNTHVCSCQNPGNAAVD